MNPLNSSHIFSVPDSGGTFGFEPSMPNDFVKAEFFQRDAATVARELIGKKINSTLGGNKISGIIIETAAYTGENDPDTHNYRGASSKSVVWGAGSLYVYSSMGYAVVTVATPPYNEGACVLIRALKITEGAESIRISGITLGKADVVDGPGKVSKALRITTEQNGQNIFHGCGIEIENGVVDYVVKAFGRKGSKAPDEKLLFKVAQ